MNDTAGKMRAEYMKNLVGKTVPVLFERENCTEFHHGYAPDYTLIKIPVEISGKSLRNRIFCVKIEESKPDFCIGRINGEI
jgi:threonylcarbamoyladenosine tRNA methylthiotransferase MtaB